MTRPKKIPACVLELLKQAWKPEKDWSQFDTNFTPENIHEPSTYVYRPDSKSTTFSGKEAKELLEYGVFGKYAYEENGVVVVNEHCEHALSDFCKEVYEAWVKYNDRIAQVEAQCPPPRVWR